MSKHPFRWLDMMRVGKAFRLEIRMETGTNIHRLTCHTFKLDYAPFTRSNGSTFTFSQNFMKFEIYWISLFRFQFGQFKISCTSHMSASFFSARSSLLWITWRLYKTVYCKLVFKCNMTNLSMLKILVPYVGPSIKKENSIPSAW